MVYCTFNISEKESVHKILEDENIRDYQLIEPVLAKNKIGNPRLNTAIWPSYNATYIMQISEESKVKILLTKLKEYNNKVDNPNELITVCSWNLENYFFE